MLYANSGPWLVFCRGGKFVYFYGGYARSSAEVSTICPPFLCNICILLCFTLEVISKLLLAIFSLI